MVSSEGAAGAAPQLPTAAFGLSLLVDQPLPGAWEERLPVRKPSLQIQLVDAATIEGSWSGSKSIGWEGEIDGARLLVEQGMDGDHRFVHGARPGHAGTPLAIHHLCSDGTVLQCAPSHRSGPSWWRVVLDSVLFIVALLNGYEALHAGAIATPDGAIAITAGTGGGKSTLLTELLGRGWMLMADDVLVLESRGVEPPLAYPAPPLMTIPAARIPALSKTNPFETICSIADERWIAMPVCSKPIPLKALVVLNRRPAEQQPSERVSLARIESPFAPLLNSLMSFPATPERQRARFELAGVLASTVELWRLTADLDAPPDVLADTLLTGSICKHAAPQTVV